MVLSKSLFSPWQQDKQPQLHRPGHLTVMLMVTKVIRMTNKMMTVVMVLVMMITMMPEAWHLYIYN